MPVKAGLLSTKSWLRGPFVRNEMVQQEQDYQKSKKATKAKKGGKFLKKLWCFVGGSVTG